MVRARRVPIPGTDVSCPARGELAEVTGDGLDGAGGTIIGPRAMGLLPIERQEPSDLAQRARHDEPVTRRVVAGVYAGCMKGTLSHGATGGALASSTSAAPGARGSQSLTARDDRRCRPLARARRLAPHGLPPLARLVRREARAPPVQSGGAIRSGAGAAPRPWRAARRSLQLPERALLSRQARVRAHLRATARRRAWRLRHDRRRWALPARSCASSSSVLLRWADDPGSTSASRAIREPLAARRPRPRGPSRRRALRGRSARQRRHGQIRRPAAVGSSARGCCSRPTSWVAAT